MNTQVEAESNAKIKGFSASADSAKRRMETTAFRPESFIIAYSIYFKKTWLAFVEDIINCYSLLKRLNINRRGTYMKAVILCGGAGTRIRDVSEVLPKPMLPIGDKPIVWHIMKIYAYYGIKEFILCLGYKSWAIKEFFLNYHAKISDVTLKIGDPQSFKFFEPTGEDDWTVTLVETGERSQTGARVWRVRKYLEKEKYFCVTYGDGVADIDIRALLDTHMRSKLIGSVAGVRPEGRFGELKIEGRNVTDFIEKPNISSGYINGGFMVFDTTRVWQYFRAGDDLVLEGEVLTAMARDGQLGVFMHEGFWYCVDTPREFTILNKLWEEDKASWKMWS
jgi:glucose-1-phosphate cytidylyltransferase